MDWSGSSGDYAVDSDHYIHHTIHPFQNHLVNIKQLNIFKLKHHIFIILLLCGCYQMSLPPQVRISRGLLHQLKHLELCHYTSFVMVWKQTRSSLSVTVKLHLTILWWVISKTNIFIFESLQVTLSLNSLVGVVGPSLSEYSKSKGLCGICGKVRLFRDMVFNLQWPNLVSDTQMLFCQDFI